MQHKKLTHFDIPLLKSEIRQITQMWMFINNQVKMLIFKNLNVLEYTVSGA
jgi:hypothetical protein